MASATQSRSVFPVTLPPKRQAARVRHLVFPREHGAWGMLLVPLTTGGILGLRTGSGMASVALLAVASLSIFCLRTPVESLAGASPMKARTPAERRAAAIAAAGYALLALASLAVLATRVAPGVLLGLGAAGAAGFVAQFIIRKKLPQERCFSQLAGSAGLTAAAAAAYYVARGSWTSTALLIWGANWLFAANQIHYVQLRIHAASCSGRLQKLDRGLHFLFGEIVLTSVLVAAAVVGALPWLVCVAYVPLLARGVAWFCEAPAPLAIRRLGYTELAHAVAFGVLLIACW